MHMCVHMHLRRSVRLLSYFLIVSSLEFSHVKTKSKRLVTDIHAVMEKNSLTTCGIYSNERQMVQSSKDKESPRGVCLVFWSKHLSVLADSSEEEERLLVSQKD